MPDAVQQLLDRFTVAITLGLDQLLTTTPLDCMSLGGYTNGLLFWTVLPFVLVLVVIVCAALWQVFRGQPRLSGVLYASLPISSRLLFLTYPIITRKAFEAFSCYRFDDGTEFLRADVAIQCSTKTPYFYSPEHERAMTAAYVAIALYPVGQLVGFGALLLAARHAITLGKPSPLSAAIQFLHRDYEADYFLWELMEMGRTRNRHEPASRLRVITALKRKLCRWQVAFCWSA